jgi:ACS family hexuronate transporter-like MFS transporter
MSSAIPNLTLPVRTNAWKWWVCGLLLLATMVNYIDRLTLNLMAKPIMTAFDLDPADYGQLESAFGTAFALGAIVMGWCADRWNVRWIYPLAVLAWSLAGFLTGLAQGFATLIACRFLLGLAEAGNWPCALRTTQRILKPEERTLGNSILQSGAAIGAVFTPLIVLGLMKATGTWRYPFMVVGGLGALWVFLWLASVRSSDLTLTQKPASASLMRVLLWLVLLLTIDSAIHIAAARPRWMPPDLAAWSADVFGTAPWLPLASKAAVTVLGILGVFWWLWRVTADDDGVPRGVFFRRFWVLAVLVVMINASWHFFRAWLPLFLQDQHHYSLDDTAWFSLAYYVSTDAGSLASGFAVLYLAKRGMSVHRGRATVFTACALLTTLSVIAAYLPAGPLLLGLLLVIGFGALGLFPAYYSFSQELTTRNQGKLTGALGCVCWLSMALLHEVVGDSVKRTGSYSQGVALAGLAPLLGAAVLLVLWGKAPSVSMQKSVPPPEAEPDWSGKREPIGATGNGITADAVPTATGVTPPAHVGVREG